MSRRGFINITPTVKDCLRESGIQEGLLLCNCQTNLVKHIAFRFAETITNQDKRINYLFKERVTNLVDTQNQRSPEDFISIDQDRKQILLQTGRTVSDSTAARWVSQNNPLYIAWP